MFSYFFVFFQIILGYNNEFYGISFDNHKKQINNIYNMNEENDRENKEIVKSKDNLKIFLLIEI